VASEAVTKELQPLLKDLDLIIGTEEEVMIAGGDGDSGRCAAGDQRFIKRHCGFEKRRKRL
ncbi:MAG: hypothetical protein VXW41_11800, partial [SAR324 cluster bacterium]|nr:hypothetical protein [SAR324 cluster bacterium]